MRSHNIAIKYAFVKYLFLSIYLSLCAMDFICAQSTYPRKYTNIRTGASKSTLKKKPHKVKELFVSIDEDATFPTDEMMKCVNLEYVYVTRHPIHYKTRKKNEPFTYPKVKWDSNRLKQLDKLQAMMLIEIDMSVFPTELLAAKNLEVLSIIKCKLNALPEEISALNRLKYLNLEHNELNSLPQSIITHDSLQVLGLLDNRFEDFPMQALTIPHLKELKMGNYGHGWHERPTVEFPYMYYENRIEYSESIVRQIESHLKEKREFKVSFYSYRCDEYRRLKSMHVPQSINTIISVIGGSLNCL